MTGLYVGDSAWDGKKQHSGRHAHTKQMPIGTKERSSVTFGPCGGNSVCQGSPLIFNYLTFPSTEPLLPQQG